MEDPSEEERRDKQPISENPEKETSEQEEDEEEEKQHTNTHHEGQSTATFPRPPQESVTASEYPSQYDNYSARNFPQTNDYHHAI